jgi:uncharacterized C2H2 Zn-finger protein
MKVRVDSVKFSLVGTITCMRCGRLFANDQSYTDHLHFCKRLDTYRNMVKELKK